MSARAKFANGRTHVNAITASAPTWAAWKPGWRWCNWPAAIRGCGSPGGEELTFHPNISFRGPQALRVRTGGATPTP